MVLMDGGYPDNVFWQHIQEKGHLAFIKDQNNFKQLDALLATVRRQYKKPLPSHMKPDIDINIDGDNVEFELDVAGTKRSIHYMDVDEEEPPVAKRSATATAIAASYPPISQQLEQSSQQQNS